MLIPLSEMKILAVQVKISWKIEINFSRRVLVHLKTRVSLEHFVNDCSYLKMISSYDMYNLMKTDDEKSVVSYQRTLLWEINYLNQQKHVQKTKLFPSQILGGENGEVLKMITYKKELVSKLSLLGDIFGEWDFDYINVENWYRLQRHGSVNSTISQKSRSIGL